MPRLREILPRQHIATRVLKIALIPESEADRRAAPIYTRRTDIETTILAHRGEIQLHLRAKAETLEVAQKKVDDLTLKMNLTTPFFPLTVKPWSRLWATTCKCADSACPSLSPAPEE